MVKNKKVMFKELILAKKLLLNSQELIKTDTLENTLLAISNLNSALEAFLKLVGTKQKIKSLKELDNISLEKQWSILSEEYERQFGEKLSMKTQIFTLSNVIQNFVEHDVLPSATQVQELYQALLVFMQELSKKVFGLDFQEIDFHLLLDNPQVQRALKAAQDAFEKGNYEAVLKNTSLAFHIALEDQRQKINYLSEKGMLNPEPFMLDKSIKLHIESNDQEFIQIILRTPQEKLERFKKIVPTVLITEDDQNRPEITISNYVDESVETKENAMFCLNFVIESILQWESIELVKK